MESGGTKLPLWAKGSTLIVMILWFSTRYLSLPKNLLER
jgi:hypothetical protein